MNVWHSDRHLRRGEFRDTVQEQPWVCRRALYHTRPGGFHTRQHIAGTQQSWAVVFLLDQS